MFLYLAVSFYFSCTSYIQLGCNIFVSSIKEVFSKCVFVFVCFLIFTCVSVCTACLVSTGEERGSGNLCTVTFLKLCLNNRLGWNKTAQDDIQMKTIRAIVDKGERQRRDRKKN